MKQLDKIKANLIDDKYQWTNHSLFKMRYYGLSQQRIKRIIRYPSRVEEAIVPNMIAVMSPAGGKRYSEIWAMYKLAGRVISKSQFKISKPKIIKIITAWRYPGKSPERNPIPKEILDEIKSLI